MASSIGFRMGSFLPTLPFKLRGLDSYPGGTLTHWFMPAFAGRTHIITDCSLDECARRQCANREEDRPTAGFRTGTIGLRNRSLVLRKRSDGHPWQFPHLPIGSRLNRRLP